MNSLSNFDFHHGRSLADIPVGISANAGDAAGVLLLVAGLGLAMNCPAHAQTPLLSRSASAGLAGAPAPVASRLNAAVPAGAPAAVPAPVLVARPVMTGDDLAGDAPVDPAAPILRWSFPQLADMARRNNPRVLAQDESAAGARSAVAAARWEYYPSPQVLVEGSRGDQLVTASVSQPLYSSGRIRAGVDAARAQTQVVERRAIEVRQDVALQALDLFAQTVALGRQIDLLKTDIGRHRALEAMIIRRVESGISAPVDLGLVQTRLNQSRTARVTAKSRQRTALAALGQVVGQDMTKAVLDLPGVTAPVGGYLVDQLDGEGLVQRCLDNSPLIARADAELRVAQAEERRSRVAMMPTVVGRFEHRSYLGGYPSGGLPDTRVTLGVQISTGAGLASIDGIRGASARTRAAMQARDAVQRDVTSSAIAALEAFTAARKSVEGLRQSELVQEQTAASYNRMFLAGKRSWLDVLNMVREQSAIERELAEAEVQLAVADYRLRILAGEIK